MFHFNIRLEYRKTNFGFILTQNWYGISFDRAKLSESQGKLLEKKQYEVDNEMHKSLMLHLSDTTNYLFLGFLRIYWTQKRDRPSHIVEPYIREEILRQRATYYNQKD